MHRVEFAIRLKPKKVPCRPACPEMKLGRVDDRKRIFHLRAWKALERPAWYLEAGNDAISAPAQETFDEGACYCSAIARVVR
jgi:2-methylisocitrate lyase-like PEP mutase family enzyme